jgi:putative glutamine amidotransferase
MNKQILIGLTSFILPWREAPKEAVYGNYPNDVNAVKEAGGIPVILPPLYTSEDVSTLLARLDGIILTGGGDIAPQFYGAQPGDLYKGVNPIRDEAEILLTRVAIEMSLPILAICRGIQVLNVALGGTLIADIPSQRPAVRPHRSNSEHLEDVCTHTIHLTPGSMLQTIFNRQDLLVNSLHHQAVDKLGEGLHVTATAPDGIIEGVELQGYPFCIGVQWHPEIKAGNKPTMLDLYRVFIKAGI